MGRSRALVVGCLLACGAPAPMPMPVVDPSIAMTATTLGPLTAGTRANLVTLRKAFVGFDVIPVNVDTKPDHPSLEYQVFDGPRQLFVVIPSSEGAILNVHVHTPRVTVQGHPWRVGSPFTGVTMLSRCQCWGGKPVCFKDGEHVAVTFDIACRSDSAKRRRTLEGVVVKRLIWKPEAFGGSEYGTPGDVEELIEP